MNTHPTSKDPSHLLDTFPVVWPEDEAASRRYRTHDRMRRLNERPSRWRHGDHSGALGKCAAEVGTVIEVSQDIAKELLLGDPSTEDVQEDFTTKKDSFLIQ